MSDALHADRVRQDFRSGVRSGGNGMRHEGSWDVDELLGALEPSAGGGSRSAAR